MEKKIRVVVLAGGSGSRLWPLSQGKAPKQFLDFGDGESLLKKTVKRFSSIASSMVISTAEHYLSAVQKEIEDLGEIDIFVEPVSKNTAPAIASIVHHFASNDEPILIVPSDHFIGPIQLFLTHVQKAIPLAEQGSIVLFGIVPTRPETGYGYIQKGELYTEDAYFIEKFIEKPPLEKAREYIQHPDYYWNAGMFLFTPSVFLKELQTHAPLIHAQIHKNQFQKIEEGIYELLSKEVYDEMPSLSIDYALMEHSRRTMLCPLSLSWSDIGSWESVYEMMDKDCNQNAKYGNTFEIESQNNLIFGGKKLIVAIGVEDLAIIDTPDAICIVKKSESQKVKQLVQLLYPTL